jgi:hypothetical protein
MDGSTISSEPPAFRYRQPGVPDPGGKAESPTLPLPPPRDRAELDQLLHAIASTPSSERQLIIDTVGSFSEPAPVAQLLHAELMDLPTQDVSRHLTLLAVIGQLRHESSADVLEQFVWLPDGQVAPPDSHGGDDPDDDRGRDGSRSGSHFWLVGAMQARAAEMLVWVDQGRRPERVDRLLAEHPDVHVRLATVDALSYSFGDDPDQLDSLRERVRVEDRWTVGLPRRTADMDPEKFDAAVQRHQEQFGGDIRLPELQDDEGEEGDDVR